MNKYLPIHKPSREHAKLLCERISDPYTRWQTVTAYVSRTITYDYIRAATIPKKNQYPDLDRTWEKRKGICMDIASLTVGMLRAVGINAYMVYGWADRNYHAWVEATIDGKTYRYDHDNTTGKKVKSYKKVKVIG